MWATADDIAAGRRDTYGDLLPAMEPEEVTALGTAMHLVGLARQFNLNLAICPKEYIVSPATYWFLEARFNNPREAHRIRDEQRRWGP